MRVRPDRSGDLADRDFIARRAEARDPSLRLGEVSRERDAERDRLGVNPVRAPNHRRRGVLSCASRERLCVRLLSGDQPIARANEEDREARVEHVAARHPAVKPARGSSDELLDVGEERDHVVLHRPLDRVDARGVDRHALLANGRRGADRHERRRFHRVTRRELDLEPDRVARARRPELDHVRRAVARNHVPASTPDGRGLPLRSSCGANFLGAGPGGRPPGGAAAAPPAAGGVAAAPAAPVAGAPAAPTAVVPPDPACAPMCTGGGAAVVAVVVVVVRVVDWGVGLAAVVSGAAPADDSSFLPHASVEIAPSAKHTRTRDERFFILPWYTRSPNGAKKRPIDGDQMSRFFTFSAFCSMN